MLMLPAAPVQPVQLSIEWTEMLGFCLFVCLFVCFFTIVEEIRGT